jgi:hypothetical protein
MEPPLNSGPSPVDKSCMTPDIDKDEPRETAANIFCRSCGSPLIQAADWEREQDSVWALRLWCPECGFEQVAALDRSQLPYLSLAIEEGFSWMLQALAELNALAAAPTSFDFARRAQTERFHPAGH